MELIQKYFPKLKQEQLSQFELLKPLYLDWNEKINVISRKDMDEFYKHHVLHALAIAKVIRFTPETTILDVGTGGGFPGIPLAILFPECQFHLVDARRKKIKVVQEVINSIGLKNVKANHERAENLNGKYDFIVSRAVTKMDQFSPWVQNNISKQQRNALPNGILYLKGGNLTKEMQPVTTFYDIYNISDHFQEAFFKTKKVVYVQLY